MMYREQLNDGEPDALGDCCHDVTTLPALNDYHERPRCASTTRRQLAAKPACSRRVTVPTKPGEDGCVRDRSGRLRQGGKVSMGSAVWSVVGSPWVDARHPMSVGHGGKYRNIRLIHGSCQVGPGRDRSLFLDSLLADQSMEQSHSRRGGRAAHARSHTPQQSPASHTRGGRQGPGAAQVDWCSHTHHAAGGGRREASGGAPPTCTRRRLPT